MVLPQKDSASFFDAPVHCPVGQYLARKRETFRQKRLVSPLRNWFQRNASLFARTPLISGFSRGITMENSHSRSFCYRTVVQVIIGPSTYRIHLTVASRLVLLAKVLQGSAAY